MTTEEHEVTCVYLAKVGNMVKVGITKNPENRARTLQTGIPEPLSMPYIAVLPRRSLAATIERRVHAQLAHRRAMGEWFRIDIEDAIDVVNRTIHRALPRWAQKLPVLKMPLDEALRLAGEDTLSGVVRREWGLPLLCPAPAGSHG